ncbi:DnaJ-like cysteine-rich domain-containing protein [Dictyobacter arantiisoli]|uniref:CR-type domain-containing protein n=1 Tax=Dictyobacter arantiisoli TaxID=2014874 RepID=A0A5A5THU1_9CHLR|nr:hypothetical protein [Dictyobacter arantiisoli]GCF10589.1 hypothetical protein KDI_41530 [Dictyobacter arantiisoli]
MSNEWNQDPDKSNNNAGNRLNQDEIDKQIRELTRVVKQGANEAQVRLKRVVNKASDYWQHAQSAPTPRQASSLEEQRLRQLINDWSSDNWRVARELGSYMDIVSTAFDETWEVSLETRWETRSMEILSEPYTGRSPIRPQPLLPVWDYELPEVAGLKAAPTRTRLEGMDEIVSCTSCNSTGHVLCSGCNGRGWIVCPECKGRTKKRCSTCRGRGYISDWTPGEKKTFFKKQADNVASTVSNKFSDVFDTIRQQGVPIPNPVDTDPASKGPTVPCPECINGEVNCSCGNGKRVCSTCQGAKMSLCSNCGGTGKVVRHREISRRFDLRSQNRFIGETIIPSAQLSKAEGDLVYSSEINETLHMDAPPDLVPQDVWRATVELVESERKVVDKPGLDPQSFPRPTLQVVELVRIPYTTIRYRYADQDYVLYVYDTEGHEKFYSDRFPARWDRVERLVKAITADLRIPTQPDVQNAQNDSEAHVYGGGYRVPVEVPPVTVQEEDEEDENGNTPPPITH